MRIIFYLSLFYWSTLSQSAAQIAPQYIDAKLIEKHRLMESYSELLPLVDAALDSLETGQLSESPEYWHLMLWKGELLEDANLYVQADSVLKSLILLTEDREELNELHLLARAHRVSTLARNSAIDQAEEEIYVIKQLVSKLESPSEVLKVVVRYYEGVLYRHRRRYTEAMDIFKSVIPEFDNMPGYELYQFKARHSLGAVAWAAGNNALIIHQLPEEKKILDLYFSEKHPFVFYYYNAVALLRHDLGDLYGALENIHKAKAIAMNSFGEISQMHFLAIYNLSSVYRQLGDWKLAETYALKSLDMTKALLGTSHYDYPMSLAQVGSLYLEMGELEKAEPFLLEALEKRAELLWKDHPHYIENLHQLGTLYLERNDFDRAAALFAEALQRGVAVEGPDHQAVADIRYSKGMLLLLQDSLHRAAQEAARAYSIYASQFDQAHLKLVQTRNLQALIALRSELPDSAFAFLREALEAQQQLATTHLRYASQRELEDRLRKVEREVALQYGCALQFPTNPEAARLAYDNALLFKGLQLQRASDLRSQLLLGDNHQARQQFQIWQGLQRSLAAEYAKPLDSRSALSTLEKQINVLEQELAQLLSSLHTDRTSARWQQVQQTLEPGSAAIEFIHFQQFNPRPEDSVFYAALVLRPEWESPQLRLLGEQTLLDSLLLGDPEALQTLYQTRSVVPGGAAPSTALYHLLWKPIESLLHGAHTVYYAPSGALHRVALHAIPLPDTAAVLADRHQLIQVLSTRDLIEPSGEQHNRKKPETALLFGGIQYDADEALSRPDSASSNRALFLPQSRSRRAEGWDFLPGSLQEVQQLHALLSEQGCASTLLRGAQASEEAFKALGSQGPAPEVLHLATHGFFFPNPKTTRSAIELSARASKAWLPNEEHPLLRSGLLLAGANEVWTSGQPPLNRDDGILTAFEMAQVNLDHTRLVVLSACETGLGDIQGFEGVLGLQRALRMAGAEQLILSLWKIPDLESAVFMEQFYYHWLNEQLSVREAFQKAQSWMRKRYPAPHIWAGFVLIE